MTTTTDILAAPALCAYCDDPGNPISADPAESYPTEHGRMHLGCAFQGGWDDDETDEVDPDNLHDIATDLTTGV